MSSTTTSAAPKPLQGGDKWLALAAMMFAVAMTFIDQTIVSIAAPSIQEELSLSDAGLQWVVNGYLLALASLFALGGRLSDILGHKKMVLIGVITFAVASTLCGFTPKTSYAEAWIVFFRVVQGAGAALMFPAALAIVFAAFPVKERGKALALFFGITGAFTALGPIVGGYLTAWTWRSIFWINIPVAIIAVILTLMSKSNTARKKDSIDWTGAGLITFGMGLSVLGFQQASSWGWGNWKTIACIIIGIVLLGIFVRMESRIKVPLIKVRIFKDRAFAADNAVLFFASMTFVPVFFFVSLYAQVSLGYSAQNAGLFLMYFFIGFVIASQIGGRILDKSGAKAPMVLGCAIAVVGYAMWGFKTTELSASAVTPYIIVAGAGIGLLLSPASTDAVNRAIDASYGEVTGITQTMRYYGSSLGFALLGTLMTTVVTKDLVSSLIGLGVPNAQANEIVSSMSSSSGGSAALSKAPSAMQEQIVKAVQTDYAEAIQVVLYGMSGLMVVAVIFAFFHPGGRFETSAEIADESAQAVAAVPAQAEVQAEGATAPVATGNPNAEAIRRIVTWVVIIFLIYLAVKYL